MATNQKELKKELISLEDKISQLEDLYLTMIKRNPTPSAT
jgi:hypothetical protein